MLPYFKMERRVIRHWSTYTHKIGVAIPGIHQTLFAHRTHAEIPTRLRAAHWKGPPERPAECAEEKAFREGIAKGIRREGIG
jgi:hypothetical protein